MLRFALAAASAAALLAPAASLARAHRTALQATVGPDDTITLLENGKQATSLRPGRYVIHVSDRATDHNFHLLGPGLSRLTSIGWTGSATWQVTLRKGVYSFQCDPHADFMKGSFRVT